MVRQIDLRKSNIDLAKPENSINLAKPGNGIDLTKIPTNNLANKPPLTPKTPWDINFTTAVDGMVKVPIPLPIYYTPDEVVDPAHGPAVDKPRQLVRGMIGHRRQREAGW